MPLKRRQGGVNDGFSCGLCHNECKDEASLESHRRVYHYFPCGDCETLFEDTKTLRQHQRDSRHCFCEVCDRFFSRPEKLMQHQHDDHGRNTEYRCCDCDKEFVDENAMNQHLENTVHTAPTAPPPIPECIKCQRAFKTEHDLAQHLASLKHNPLSNIPCVASKKCKKKFTSPSALAHHLESGTCRSGITRKKLNAAIQATDHHRIITSAAPMRLLSDTGTSAGASSPFGVFTPDTDSTSGVPLSPGLFTPASTSTAGAAFPLNPLACPLCPPSRRPFSTTKDLEQHIASPAHDAKIFSCPSTLFTDVEVPIIKRFTTLSGLTQHLESGACAGGKETLRRAVKLVEEKLRGMGFSWEGVRLLL